MHSPLPVLGRGEPERYDSPAQVAGDLNVSLLGALARTDTVRGPLALPDLVDPEAHYDAVADRIQLLAGQMPLKLLGVIGLGDDPLRFRLAANLAGRLAANGRQVTIVEAELGGPVLRHDRTRREGLLDMLLYGCSFTAVGRESGIRGVKLVSAGSHPWSGEPIHGDEWERVLGSLRQHSDFTLVTTTTGLPAPILGMLARRLDSIVIAYALHWSGREAVRRSYLALWDMDAPILGLVTEGPHAALASASAVAAQASASRGREREIAPQPGTAWPRSEIGHGTASESGRHAAPPKLGAQWARRLLGDAVEEMPPITEEVEVVIRQTSEVDAASAALWEKEVDRLRGIIAAPDGVAPFADPEAEPREAPVREWQAPPPREAPEPKPLSAPAGEPEPPFSAEAATPPPLPLPEVLHREAIPSGGNALPGERIQITDENPPAGAPLPEVLQPPASAPLPEVLHREASPASGSARPEEHIQITFEPPSGGAHEAPEMSQGVAGSDPLPEVLKREAMPPLSSPSSAEGKIDIVVDRMFGLGGGSPAALPSGTGVRRTIPVALPGVPKPLEPAPAPPPPAEKELAPPPPATPEVSSDAALDAAFDLTSDFLSDTPPSAALDAIPEIPAEKTPFPAPDDDALGDDPLRSLDSPLAVPSFAPGTPHAPDPEPDPFIEPTGPGREVFASSPHVKPEVTPPMEIAAEATPVAGDDTAADLPWLRPEPVSSNDSTDFLAAPLPRRRADREGSPSPLAGLTRSELEPEPASIPAAGAKASMPMSPFPAPGTPVTPSGPAIPAETFAEPQFPELAGATEQAMALDQQVIEAIEEELVGAQATARTAVPPTPVHKNRTPWRVFILGSLVGLAAVVFWAYRSGAIRLEPRPPHPSTVVSEGTEPVLTPDPAATDVIPVGEEPVASTTPHAAVEAPPEPALDLPGGDEPLTSQETGGDPSEQPSPVTASEGTSESPAPEAPPAPIESAKAPSPVAQTRQTETSGVRVVGEAPRGFGVHVGSFRTPAFAEKDLARFTGRGYSGLLVEVAVPGKGMWQRVVLGPYPTLSAAEEVAAEVRAAGLSPKAQSMSLKP